MKKLILGSVSAAALLFAGAAFAAGNSSTIDQIGFDNSAAVDQSSSPSDAVAQITQGLAGTDAYNSASVTQGGGAGNEANITQSQGSYGAVSNPSNVSNSNQQGSWGQITVVQVGDNASSITQYGGSVGEYALVGQSHTGNDSTIGQYGNSEFALVNQEVGTGNSANIVQWGTGAGNSGPGAGNYSPTPSSPRIHGPGNLWWSENVPGSPEASVLPATAGGNTRYGQTGADVDQVGSNNVGGINQAGYQNFADVSQENDGSTAGNYGAITQGAGLYQSDAVMYQLGQANTGVINQSGAGSAYSTVWQNGTSNQAYATQVGSETSVIGQGVTGDGPRDGAFVDTVSNDYANVYQSGGGDSSLVTQTGNNDTANVQQLAANATSVVSQGGSYNTATVHQ